MNDYMTVADPKTVGELRDLIANIPDHIKIYVTSQDDPNMHLMHFRHFRDEEDGFVTLESGW